MSKRRRKKKILNVIPSKIVIGKVYHFLNLGLLKAVPVFEDMHGIPVLLLPDSGGDRFIYLDGAFFANAMSLTDPGYWEDAGRFGTVDVRTDWTDQDLEDLWEKYKSVALTALRVIEEQRVRDHWKST